MVDHKLDSSHPIGSYPFALQDAAERRYADLQATDAAVGTENYATVVEAKRNIRGLVIRQLFATMKSGDACAAGIFISDGGIDGKSNAAGTKGNSVLPIVHLEDMQFFDDSVAGHTWQGVIQWTLQKSIVIPANRALRIYARTGLGYVGNAGPYSGRIIVTGTLDFL